MTKPQEGFIHDVFGPEDKCPNCGSKNYEPVEPFDYIKLCIDCNEQFVGHIHN